MQTADATPVESTRKALPEMPYMQIERPAPFGGPKLSTATLADDTTPGDYLFAMGAGKSQSGWLTLAAASLKGYGTQGQAASPVSYVNPVQASVPTDCKAVYLGVIAYPIVDQAAGYLNLAIAPATWASYDLISKVAKTAPTAPLPREAAAFLAAGAASIALVGMSLF
jgi:hypothetical protein